MPAPIGCCAGDRGGRLGSGHVSPFCEAADCGAADCLAKLGKHVRLDSSDLDVLIGAGRVEVTNAAAAPFYP